ncbi:MAG: hypothetical protein WAX69_22750 [Victivallales bacterium]
MENLSGSKPLWKLILICISFGALLFCHAAEPDAQQSSSPGWVVHYYGEPTFWFYGGSFVANGADISADINKLKWPAANSDPAKGAEFHRAQGWSMACRSSISIPTEGEYKFKIEEVESELKVNGIKCPVDGTGKIRLDAGTVPITLYLKYDGARPDATRKSSRELMKAVIKWQKPGASDFKLIPPEALSHTVKDSEEKLAWRPDILLEKWRDEIFNQRTTSFEIKDEGLYEIAIGPIDPPRWFKAWFDDKPLFYLQGERRLDPGVKQGYALDFLHRAGALRHLKAGKHTLAIYRVDSPYPWVDKMDELMPQMRIGISKIHSGDTVDIGIHAVDKNGMDRDDMILAKDEPLTIKVEKMVGAGERFLLEVKEQRGSKTPVWTGEGKLAKEASHLSASISYPSNTEGAFEYTVKDASGKIIDGPWAFVVIDPTPMPLPKGGASTGEIRRELVDSVDCTLTQDAEHKFRDNGTSRVVDSPVGRYRLTGNAGVELDRRCYYIKDAETKKYRRVREGEKKSGASYISPDWFAYTLKVKKPGKAHLVVATIPNDKRRIVVVQAIDQVTSWANGSMLDSGNADVSGPFSTLSFLVWPNSGAVDVFTVCHNGNHNSRLNREGAISKIELYELPEGLPPLPEPAGGWEQKREFGADSEQTNIWAFESTMPPLWEGNDFISGLLSNLRGGFYQDWRALHAGAERYTRLSRYRGDNLIMVPALSYNMTFLQGVPHLPKGQDVYSTGGRGRLVDPIERDIFKMLLMTGQKNNARMVADLMVSRLSEGAVQHFARKCGYEAADELFVTDSNGKCYDGGSGWTHRILNPAHPASRKYFTTVLGEISRQYGGFPSFAGVRLRWWTPWQSGFDPFYISDSNGYDDFTVSLFEKETGVSIGVANAGDERFKLRREHLLKDDLRDKWIDWRCQKVESLLEEGVAELRRNAPSARLYSGAYAAWKIAPARESGIDYASLAGRRDIGFEKWEKFRGGNDENIELNGFDPVAFANFDVREPAEIRGNIENFTPGDTAYIRNLCHDFALIGHPRQLEQPAKALAAGQLDRIVCGELWGISPVDEGLRSFVRVFRAIPDLKYERFAGKGSDQPVVVCWSAQRQDKTGWIFHGKELVFYLVNQTPYRRELEISLPKDADGVKDLVSGETLAAKGNVVNVSLDPFMPALFAAKGITSIEGMNIQVRPDEIERIGKQVEFLRKINAAAGDMKHVFVGAGGCAAGVKDTCEWDRRDAIETFAGSFNPVDKAWRDKEYLKAGFLIQRIASERRWWLEAFGWPDGMEDYAVCSGNAGYLLQHNFKPEGAAKLAKLAQYTEEDFVVIPSGKTVYHASTATAGQFELRIRGLFGKGYGPIKVGFNGKTVGTIGEGYGETRHIRNVLSVPLSINSGLYDMTLTSEGANGLAISSMEMAFLPPVTIKKWSAIGLFDFNVEDGKPYTWEKRSECYAKATFPPEKEISLSSEYKGMDGKSIQWRQIDIGDDKYVKLLEKYYPYVHIKNYGIPGSGIAYLASWIYSPGRRNVILYYAMDWDGRVWLNDEPVLDISGPWGKFASKTILLNAGWNKLLVKTTTGRDGWNANFAVSDPGDQKYSPTPPETGK